MPVEGARRSYRELLWVQLEQYKHFTLGIQASGYWKKNKLEYPHILPLNMKKTNILEPYREEFWDWFESQKIKLHSDFHHLSSSQAMCFNLFYPFMAEAGTHQEILQKLFVVDGVIREARFEVILSDGDKTNFDFCIFANSKTLFEIKLSEDGFACAKRDSGHEALFSNFYSSELGDKFKPEFCSPEVFLRNYQIMRNVWNLKPSSADSLVFLVPRANSSLMKDLAFAESCLSDTYRRRVSISYLEDVVARIDMSLPEDATRLRKHFQEFRLKYLPPISTIQAR